MINIPGRHTVLAVKTNLPMLIESLVWSRCWPEVGVIFVNPTKALRGLVYTASEHESWDSDTGSVTQRLHVTALYSPSIKTG